MSKKFPDLTGDGKVTKADILKGRKVFAEGGSLMIPVERQQYAFGAAVKGIISAAKKAGGKAIFDEPLDSGVKEGIGIDNKAIEKALSTRNIENKNALFFNKKELKERFDDNTLYHCDYVVTTSNNNSIIKFVNVDYMLDNIFKSYKIPKKNICFVR